MIEHLHAWTLVWIAAAPDARLERQQGWRLRRSTMTNGPLAGLKVLEFASLGPGPLAGTILSDMGADIVRIERLGTPDPRIDRIDARGRRTIALDLKTPDAITLCLDLAGKAEIVLEGFRPGVMERLGLGPEAMRARNPRLVYGRITGWGQFGPYASIAGHDINYLSLSGALHAIGTADRPIPPLNLVADYGGGTMFLVAGVLAALLHARASGEGQVVDAAMTDGAAMLMSLFYGKRAAGEWHDQRESNLLDGSAPFYTTYACADGKWISVGAIEPQFYTLLLTSIGAEDCVDHDQMDKAAWPLIRSRLASIFATRSREDWIALLQQSDVCVAPILSLDEAPDHPHNVARSTFVTVAGVPQPAPAPRFSATPSRIQGPPEPIGKNGRQALEDWGLVSIPAHPEDGQPTLRCP
jgi:alpha-methylacyl-CoA racemase